MPLMHGYEHPSKRSSSLNDRRTQKIEYREFVICPMSKTNKDQESG